METPLKNAGKEFPVVVVVVVVPVLVVGACCCSCGSTRLGTGRCQWRSVALQVVALTFSGISGCCLAVQWQAALQAALRVVALTSAVALWHCRLAVAFIADCCLAVCRLLPSWWPQGLCHFAGGLCCICKSFGGGRHQLRSTPVSPRCRCPCCPFLHVAMDMEQIVVVILNYCVDSTINTCGAGGTCLVVVVVVPFLVQIIKRKPKRLIVVLIVICEQINLHSGIIPFQVNALCWGLMLHLQELGGSISYGPPPSLPLHPFLHVAMDMEQIVVVVLNYCVDSTINTSTGQHIIIVSSMDSDLRGVQVWCRWYLSCCSGSTFLDCDL